MKRIFKRSPRRQRSVDEVRSPRHPAERLQHTVAAAEAEAIMNAPTRYPRQEIQNAQSAQAQAVHAAAHAHAVAARAAAQVRGTRGVAKPVRPPMSIYSSAVPTAVASPLPQRVFFGALDPVLVDDDPRIPEVEVMTSSPRRTQGAGAGAGGAVTEAVGAAPGDFEQPPPLTATATSEYDYGVREARRERDDAMEGMVQEQHKYQQAFGADAQAVGLERLATSPRKFYAERRLRKANRQFQEKEQRFLDAIKRVQEGDINLLRQAQSRSVRRAQQEDKLYGRYYTTIQPGQDLHIAADIARRNLYPNHNYQDADLLSTRELQAIQTARDDGRLPSTLSTPRQVALRQLALHPDMPGQGEYTFRQRTLPIPWEQDDPNA